MERRAFLALGAAAAAAAGSTGCASAPPARAGTPAAPAPHADLEEATIAELAARMTRGELTAQSLCERYAARIEAIDRSGPTLRSVIEWNPDAMAIAAALDDERRTKGPRGPLHGVPVLLKDNLDTGDRMLTTAGSLALAGAPALADSFVAARLRAAGAVILGKTNLSEWANIRSTHSTSGWSARGGLTRNPYALDRNTSGSSSGSAAAVAASLCAAAIGTETDGSIVSPSSLCGVVGLKPTVGLVSRAGIVPIAHTQDTAGPMARSVADAAILLAAIAGVDPRDPATAAQPARSADVYLKALALGLDRDGARGLRVGVVRALGHVIKPVTAIFDAAIEDLRRLGAVIVDPVDLGPMGKLDDPELTILLHELKADMATYLAGRGPGIAARSLADLARWNREHAESELRWFDQELFDQALATGGLDAPVYREALATCKRIARDEGIDAAMARDHLDVLVAPTGGPAWLSDLVNGDAFTGSSSTPAAVAGCPSITVPAGALHGLPIGISFFAGLYAEPMLLRVASAYEQATKRRAKPLFLPTIDLGSPDLRAGKP
ncbi:MAG: amidase [Byssovorax sp.]